MAIPLFILAGTDPNDSFASERIFKLKFQGKFLLEYLLEEAKKSNLFSDIYLLSDKNLKDKFSEKCFFIESTKSLRRNLRIIHSTTKKIYRTEDTQIAILVSDILPQSSDFRELFSTAQEFLDRDIILFFTPSEILRKKRGKHFFRKDDNSPPLPYAGTGGLYILRPLHLREKFIYFLAGLRMPRLIRKIEFENYKLVIHALQTFRGFLFFITKVLIIFLNLPFILNELSIFLKTFIRHQRRLLTFKEAEKNVSRLFIKKEFLKNKNNDCRILVINNPVFVEDIDREEDIKILANKKAPVDL